MLLNIEEASLLYFCVLSQKSYLHGDLITPLSEIQMDVKHINIKYPYIQYAYV